MRRISEAEFTKKRNYVYVSTALMLVFALVLFFLPELFPSPKYDELLQKEITVAEFRRVHRYKSGNDYIIETTENESYNLTGDFDYGEVKNILLPETKATIKYSKNRFFFSGADYAEEVIVDGNTIVTYNNDNTIGPGRTPLVVLGIILIVVAATNLYSRLKHLNYLKAQQEKRDRRIEKKYGNNKGG